MSKDSLDGVSVSLSIICWLEQIKLPFYMLMDMASGVVKMFRSYPFVEIKNHQINLFEVMNMPTMPRLRPNIVSVNTTDIKQFHKALPLSSGVFYLITAVDV